MKKLTGISVIIRLVLMLFFPTITLATGGDTNASDKKESPLAIIENGKISTIYSDECSYQLSISNNVLKKQFETKNESGLSAYNQNIKGYSTVHSPINSNKTINILVTGYSSTPDQCWGDPFITASGTRVHKGTIACPPQYPFGTKIKIDGTGTFICEDRGGAIKGNHFDIWFESRSQALQWGKRSVIAQIIY